MMRIRQLVTAIIILIFAAALVSAQTIQINRDNKTIAISTSDEATATADLAAVAVGFEIYGPDSASTYANAGQLSHAVLDALHNAGVKDESIESAQQELQRYNDNDSKDNAEQRAKKQFVFRQSWEVSVAPQNAAEVIHLAIETGANQSGSIEWRLSDRKALQAKAAEAALVKARAVADRMAEGLHVKLGALIYASNETPNSRLYFANPKFMGGLTSTASVSVATKDNTPNLEIRPQTMREEAAVYAVFAIESCLFQD